MEAHALKVVLGTLFLEDPGSKNRTWNWKLAGQAVSNCKYDFFNACLPPKKSVLARGKWLQATSILGDKLQQDIAQADALLTSV